MIKLVRKLVADERGVLTAGAFIFFLAAFGVFGSVLSVKYYASQKENVLGAAEAAAVTTIRAIHEGRKGEPIKTLDDAKAFARAAMVALSDGTDLDRLMDSNIPNVSESADKIIDVKLFKYSDSFEAFSQVAGDGTDPTVGSSGLTEATTLADVGLVVIEVHFTEERQSSLSAGFYNFVSPRRDLQVRAIGAAYVPNCTQTGLYSASSIDIQGRLIANGPSCIRTDRAWASANKDGVNIHVWGKTVAADSGGENPPGKVHFVNIDQFGHDDLDRKNGKATQIEISTPNTDGLDRAIPKARVQKRTWRVKEFYDFDTIYREFLSGFPRTFFPDYLETFGGFIPAIELPARRPKLEDEPAGINIVEVEQSKMDNLYNGKVLFIKDCGSGQDQVRLKGKLTDELGTTYQDETTYQDIVILTSCRLIIDKNVKLRNMTILSQATPVFGKDDGTTDRLVKTPSIRFEAGAERVGNNTNYCATAGGGANEGVLIWTGKGTIETEGPMELYDTQFIMGSLPRNKGTGKEAALEDLIEQALEVHSEKKFVNTFGGVVALQGSSILSLYPTEFKDDLSLNGCINKNLSNRHFRPHFKPISFVELEPELFE